jgi:cytidylate kinase
MNLETGAMYRALAFKAMQRHIGTGDEASLVALCSCTSIELESTDTGNRVLLDGQDVSASLRDAQVTASASQISVHPEVRHWMVARQREMGSAGGVVMEGRDIGTAVFPDAEIKIFLDADPQIRGSRRFQQVAGKPDAASTTEASVIEEMRARDQRDRSRAQSPLVAAEDAVRLDSTTMTLEEVLQRCEEIVRTHLPLEKNSDTR